MKVIIDDKIPFIREAAALLFDRVVYLPGREIMQSSETRTAHALIIRTRTRCDLQSLRDTNVRFVASATIGYDHIVADDMQRLGIAWTNCPGCNASSVGQYVRNALILVARQHGVTLADFSVGIVGFGHVGKAVCHALKAVGCHILVNDPPLAQQGGAEVDLIGLDRIATQCDVVTFHTPLTTDGQYPTFHLANQSFFQSLRRRPVIINAARGGVVDEQALLLAHHEGRVTEMIIDTWEDEPHINPALLDQAYIATPHVAGYSADGKSNATRMALTAVCRHFNIVMPDHDEFLKLTAPPSLPSDVVPSGDPEADFMRLYNPLDDTRRLKAAPQDFEQLRGNYPLRREQYS